MRKRKKTKKGKAKFFLGFLKFILKFIGTEVCKKTLVLTKESFLPKNIIADILSLLLIWII